MNKEMEIISRQYDKVVEQNKSLQKELLLAKTKLDMIKVFLENQKVVEPATAYVKARILRYMELN